MLNVESGEQILIRKADGEGKSADEILDEPEHCGFSSFFIIPDHVITVQIFIERSKLDDIHNKCLNRGDLECNDIDNGEGITTGDRTEPSSASELRKCGINVNEKMGTALFSRKSGNFDLNAN